MALSGTGQAPTLFWSSLEAMKDWVVSLGSEVERDGGRTEGAGGGGGGGGGGGDGGTQPWELLRDRHTDDPDWEEGDGLTGKVPVSWMWRRAASMSGTEMASAQSQSTSPSLMGSLDPCV